jgi:hypothetical protein
MNCCNQKIEYKYYIFIFNIIHNMSIKSFLESIADYKKSMGKFDTAVDGFISASLINAVSEGHIHTVQEIFDYKLVDINAVHPQKWNPSITLLCNAIISTKMNGQTKINMIIYLLNSGANPNLKYIDDDGDEYFALYTAGILYIQGCNIKDKTYSLENTRDAIEIIDILIRLGVDVNQQTKEYSNIMCVGVMFGSIDLIKLCVTKYGAIITNLCLLCALSDENNAYVSKEDIIRYLVFEKKLINTVEEIKTGIRLESRLHQNEDEIINTEKQIEKWIV